MHPLWRQVLRSYNIYFLGTVFTYPIIVRNHFPHICPWRCRPHYVFLLHLLLGRPTSSLVVVEVVALGDVLRCSLVPFFVGPGPFVGFSVPR